MQLNWSMANISTLVKHLIIGVNKDQIRSSCETMCDHVRGIRWDRIINSIATEHNENCKHTGFKLSSDMLVVSLQEHSLELDNSDSSSTNKVVPKFKNSRHKPAQCLTCHKWFRTKWHLAKHEPVHSKIKIDYQCEDCERVFKSLGYLKNHRKTHVVAKAEVLPDKSIDENTNCNERANTECRINTIADQPAANGHVERYIVDALDRQKPNHPIDPHKFDNVVNRPLASPQTKKADLVEKERLRHTEVDIRDEAGPRNTTDIDILADAEDLGDSDHSANAEDSVATGGQAAAEESADVANTSTSKEKKVSGFKCSHCQKAFKARTKLNRHEITHTENRKVFPCQVCNKICKTQWHLQKHESIHCETKQYKCNQCTNSFGQKLDYQKHLSKIHNTFEQHACDVCDKVYKNYTTLQDHQKEHSGETYPCDICLKVFSRPDTLRKHKAHHKSKANPQAFPCNSCERSFPTKSRLNVHVRKIHLQEKNHKCSFCTKSFFTRFEKTSHESTHTGALSYVCRYCQKGFKQKATLAAHLKSHSKQKPFTCHFCGKSFSQKVQVLRHETIHSAKRTRQFKCSFCGQWFLKKTHLDDHEKRHQGIRNYKCVHCKAAFVTKGDLIRHLKRHMDGKMYSCNVCQVKFSKRSELLEHQVIHG